MDLTEGFLRRVTSNRQTHGSHAGSEDEAPSYPSFDVRPGVEDHSTSR